MITRCSISRIARLRAPNTSTSINNITRWRVPRKRAFSSTGASSSSAASSESATSSALAPFGSLTYELDKIAPRFEIEADQVEIYREPKDFFEALKEKILGAKKRIFLSTLYVGKAEHEMLDTIRAALRQSPELKVSILTDYLRGTRESPGQCCASLLSGLAADFPERVEIRMFHTPNLAGFKKAVLPKRINEGWGLQHMKLYGFDDEVMLSGANLSTDYFTVRQDRYHLISSADVTRFYERIHDTVCSISFRLTPSPTHSSEYTFDYPSTNPGPSPLTNPKAYIRNAHSLLAPLLRPSPAQLSAPGSDPTAATTTNPSRTLLYPILQFTPLFSASHKSDTNSTELPALTLLLNALSFPPFRPARWTFTAGYFNMTPTTRDLLLSSLATSNITTHRSTTDPQPEGRVITAHPHANGFYASKGVSGMLPDAYTLMSKRFLDVVFAEGMSRRLGLYEWKRGVVNVGDGWSYHAKGLWVTLPDSTSHNLEPQAGPAITVIGSSNYTARSHTLDLEANALVLTTDRGLQGRLREEEEHLMTFAGRKLGREEFEGERAVGWKVKVALWVVGVIGGAL